MRLSLLSAPLPALALAGYFAVASSPAFAQAAAPASPAAPAGGQSETPSTSSDQASSVRTLNFLDLSAGAGYASNPALRFPATSSAFARLSAMGYHGWRNERGTTFVSGFVEDTSYLRGGYGSKVIFRVNARADRSLNEKVTVFGDVALSGDVAGQLTNRFTPGPVVNPPDANPPPVDNLEVFNLTGRQYRLTANAGAGIKTSLRSSISMNAGVSRGIYTGKNKGSDYTTYQAGIGYTHQMSERTWIGPMLNLSRQDYRGNNYANVVNPTMTLNTQLGENVKANASVGLLAIYEHRDGETAHAYSPSFSAAICKAGERSSLCANLNRTAQAPLGLGAVQGTRATSVNTNFGVTYSRQLGPSDSLQANVIGSHGSSIASGQNERFRTTYVTTLVGYDRKVGQRLFAGVTLGARRLFQNGPDPKSDLNGNVYLRYRLGDLQ